MKSTYLIPIVAVLLTALLPAAPQGKAPETGSRAASKPTSRKVEKDKSVVPDDAPPGFDKILRQNLIRHASYLASDELQGRLTGSPGQLMAAKYIAGHFRQLGLKPLGDKKGSKRSFFQKYPIERTYLDKKTSMTIGKKAFRDGFLVYPAKGEAKPVRLRGPLVLAGRVGGAGGSVKMQGLKGRIPVVFVRALEGAGNINNQFMASFSVINRMIGKARLCARNEAKAVVFCPLNDTGPLCSTMTYAGLCHGKDLLKFGRDAGIAGQLRRTKIPWFVTSRKVTDAILKQMQLTRQEVSGRISNELVERVTVVNGKALLNVKIHVDSKAQASNVVAVLPGSDPKLAGEAIVFSAHMDHIGVHLNGDVFNGADDNASGSAGLMAIATAFARSGKKPRRSVIFLSVSGEELGLWGSAYFADHPTWPVDRIIANINTDMIGRSGPEAGEDEISVTPSYRHGKFSTIVQDSARLAKKLGLGLTSGDKYYMRSDHYNFAKKGIPVVFFCNGEHEDYHQVSDHADKLDPMKMERVARLAYWTGYVVANASGRPQTLGASDAWTDD